MEINIFEVLKTNIAISHMQATEVKKLINYDAKKVVLDFKKITDVTTAFMNAILDGFYPKLKAYQQLNNHLKIKNGNQSVKFAFGDSYKLFKARYAK